jgi:cell division protein FtsQ
VTTTQAVLGAGLVLGLSVTLAWGARHYVLTSPRFAVTDVTVQGTRVRSIEGVAAAAGVERGMNVFSLDLDRARAKVLTDAWIATASLSRRLPGTVVIQVTEREAAAIVALPETYLASRDGRIFKRFEVGDRDDLPIVTGLTGDGVAQDREGAERAVLRAIDLATEYQRTSLGARAPLEEVHVSNGNELTLVVGKDTVSLALGAPRIVGSSRRRSVSSPSSTSAARTRRW